MPRGTGRLDEALFQGRLWTPALLMGTANLGAWFDASDLSSIAAASGVDTWVDKSGFGHTVFQSSTLRPAFNALGLVGAKFVGPAIVFDGTNDALSFMALSGTVHSMHAVVNNSGAATTRTITCGNNGSMQLRLESANTLGLVQSNQAALFATTATVPTGPVQVGADVGVNRCDLWINGTVETSSANGTFTNSISDFGFNQGTANEYFDSGISEWLATNAILSALETAYVQGYLAWKWGIEANLPASHTYKNYPPLIGT